MATVTCCRCGEEKDAISGPTYGGPIGEELKRRVCNACWLEWFNGFGVKVINEMQLNMRNPEHVHMLMDQMRLFLNMPKEGEGEG
jgi:Fe-S cluster biosynthesis and repair protein YggX